MWFSLEIARRRSGGNFREKIANLSDIGEDDFANPWKFYSLFMSEPEKVNEWMRQHGLLPYTLTCNSQRDDGRECGGIMSPTPNSSRSDGVVFKCDKNRKHQRANRTLSFFEKMNITIPDAMVFIKCYLDKCTLLQCATFSGVAYKTTAVNWRSFVREMFKEYFHRHIKDKKLSGEIEIDESLFGRRVKHNRGNPNAGLKVTCFFNTCKFETPTI